jgi:hypothetical protein
MKFNVTAMHEHNLQLSYHMMDYRILSYWIILENFEVLVRLAFFFALFGLILGLNTTRPLM